MGVWWESGFVDPGYYCTRCNHAGIMHYPHNRDMPCESKKCGCMRFEGALAETMRQEREAKGLPDRELPLGFLRKKYGHLFKDNLQVEDVAEIRKFLEMGWHYPKRREQE